MTNDDRIRNLQTFGYTQTEAAFLCLAALQSGHFMRRQYYEFTGHGKGGGDSRLAEKVTQNQHATPTAYRFNRVVYHLSSKPFYAALGEEDNRNRRTCQPYTIRHKLMTLDFVLSQPQCRFLATIKERFEYFQTLACPTESLPMRAYLSNDGKSQTPSYFVDKSPIFLDPSLPAPVVSFAYINDGDFAYHDFRAYLNQYQDLFRAVPEFRLVFAGRDQKVAQKAARQFNKFLGSDDGSAHHLLIYFHDRNAFENRQTRGWDKARIDRFRDDRDRFSAPKYDVLFARWRAEGDGAVTSTGRLNGTFETALIRHNYDLFGGKYRAAS